MLQGACTPSQSARGSPAERTHGGTPQLEPLGVLGNLETRLAESTLYATFFAIRRERSFADHEEHIARAQEIKATLEALEVAIASHQLSEHEPTSQYLRTIEDTSFIEAAG